MTNNFYREKKKNEYKSKTMEASQKLIKALKNVSVIGAAGKMGRGIALLLLQEMARQEAELTGQVGQGNYCLSLIDIHTSSFTPLKNYLRVHITKYAEKNINSLRKCYSANPDLISNEEIIRSFVQGALDNVCYDTEIYRAKDSFMVFEAIIEDLEEKVHLFSALDALCLPEVCFFTNTSSIPIHIIQEKAQLGDRIIGFHFYNPPQIQKLVEVIFPTHTDPSLKELADNLGRRLQKDLIYSKDSAGFIGNGYLFREISFACCQIEELSHIYPLEEALYLINFITQEYLIRPMGIFQLIDYIGIDVCQKISSIMGKYIPEENFHFEIIDKILSTGINGGQHPEGTQKNGFFKYDARTPTGIYSFQKKEYEDFNDNDWMPHCKSILGEFPEGHHSWKQLASDPNRQGKLETYFHHLARNSSFGAELAKAFLTHSNEISEKLIQDHVCRNAEDLAQVLKNGFFHLYSPNEFNHHRNLKA